jgi:hypothetical protein
MITPHLYRRIMALCDVRAPAWHVQFLLYSTLLSAVVYDVNTTIMRQLISHGYLPRSRYYYMPTWADAQRASDRALSSTLILSQRTIDIILEHSLYCPLGDDLPHFAFSDEVLFAGCGLTSSAN